MELKRNDMDIFGRLREASTWAGLGTLAMGVARLVDDPLSADGWMGVIGGLTAIIKREAVRA